MRMITMILVLSAAVVSGCNGFGPPPGSAAMTDAGVMPTDDAGSMPRPSVDGGMRLPPEVDSGPPLGEVPSSGDQCDPDHDRGTFYDCALEGCDRAYLVCLGDEEWHCVWDTGASCTPRVETDAGVDSGPPAEADAGAPATATDSGTPATGSDAGPSGPHCVAGSFVGCDYTCAAGRWFGVIWCDPSSGYTGTCQLHPAAPCPVPGTDAGTAPVDAGVDAGPPAMTDAGSDAGTDAGTDAGSDAGRDAGPSAAMHTVTLSFRVDPALLYSTSTQEMLEEMALRDATRADARPLACETGSGLFTDSASAIWYRCIVTRAVGSELFFSGSFMTRYSADYGSTDRGVWSTFSSWNPGGSNCGDLAATRGVTWTIVEGAPTSTYSGAGRSLLPATGIPEIVQPRNITEDGRRVCRGRLVF